MKSRSSSGPAPGQPVYSRSKLLRIILTDHAIARIKSRIEEQHGERMVIPGLPYVRLLELWDNLTHGTLHGLLVNGGALLLGKLDDRIPEFVAVTLLSAEQVHCRGRLSRLIPMSAAVYELPADYIAG